MMITSVIPTPSETQQKTAQTLETVVTIAPNKPSVFGTSPYLPVLLPKSSATAPESFIELFWQLTQSATNRLKSFLEQGISIWVEAFSTIATVQQLETQLVPSSVIEPSYLSPAFRLKSEDTETSLVSTLITERRLHTASPFQSAERNAWLATNQWDGLDDLFPADSITEVKAVDLKDETEESSMNPLPVATASTVTASTILGALNEAYPITTPEEAACLKHPLIQRGRAVKQNINQLVEAYFSTEEATD